jgi:hypothetical protein
MSGWRSMRSMPTSSSCRRCRTATSVSPASRATRRPERSSIFSPPVLYEHRAYGMNAAYPHGHHGNAILSRHRIVAHTNHDISDHVLEKRGLLHAVIRLRARTRQGCAPDLCALRADQAQPPAPGDLSRRFRSPRGTGQGAADHRRRFQRLAAAGRPCAARAARRRRGDYGIDLRDPRPRLLDWLLPWRSRRSDTGPEVARTFPSFAPWLTLDRIYVRGFRGARHARSQRHCLGPLLRSCAADRRTRPAPAARHPTRRRSGRLRLRVSSLRVACFDPPQPQLAFSHAGSETSRLPVPCQRTIRSSRLRSQSSTR